MIKTDIHPHYEHAVAAINEGDLDTVHALLAQYPDLATARDDGNATLFIPWRRSLSLVISEGFFQ